MKVHALLVCFALVSLPLSAAADISAPVKRYPFERFVGVWKLKDDRFQQVWDGETVETLSIPMHRTNCAPINTDKSVLCVVDAVDFQGHILWAVNAETRTVSHLSHFGESRLGQGSGTIAANGDLTLNIRFTDEPPGTSRNYAYTWITDNEYLMRSIQVDENGQPTGNWYGGSFVRVEAGK